MQEVDLIMVKQLDVEAVRFSTMQTILSLAKKRDVMKFIVHEFGQLNGKQMPIKDVISMTKDRFPELTVELTTELPYSVTVGFDDTIAVYGNVIDIHNYLSVTFDGGSYEDFLRYIEEEELTPAHFDKQIEKAKHALKRVVPLVAKYNNSVQALTRVENELQGLTFA